MGLPYAVHPEQYEILRCPFATVKASAQNDKRGEAQDDRWMLLMVLAQWLVDLAMPTRIR